jgi:hypothetical protein
MKGVLRCAIFNVTHLTVRGGVPLLAEKVVVSQDIPPSSHFVSDNRCREANRSIIIHIYHSRCLSSNRRIGVK